VQLVTFLLHWRFLVHDISEGVFPFRRMPCKLFFPPFSFLTPFINAIQPFYGCQRNARKNITVTVSVRVSVTVRVSLVWRHRHFLFKKISKWHGFSANWDSAKWGITEQSILLALLLIWLSTVRGCSLLDSCGRRRRNFRVRTSLWITHGLRLENKVSP